VIAPSLLPQTTPPQPLPDSRSMKLPAFAYRENGGPQPLNSHPRKDKSKPPEPTEPAPRAPSPPKANTTPPATARGPTFARPRRGADATEQTKSLDHRRSAPSSPSEARAMPPSPPISRFATTSPSTASSPAPSPSSRLFNPNRRPAAPRPTIPNRPPVKPGPPLKGAIPLRAAQAPTLIRPFYGLQAPPLRNESSKSLKLRPPHSAIP
jgi:hypothetical protein